MERVTEEARELSSPRWFAGPACCRSSKYLASALDDVSRPRTNLPSRSHLFGAHPVEEGTGFAATVSMPLSVGEGS